MSVFHLLGMGTLESPMQLEGSTPSLKLELSCWSVMTSPYPVSVVRTLSECPVMKGLELLPCMVPIIRIWAWRLTDWGAVRAPEMHLCDDGGPQLLRCWQKLGADAVDMSTEVIVSRHWGLSSLMSSPSSLVRLPWIFKPWRKPIMGKYLRPGNNLYKN